MLWVVIFIFRGDNYLRGKIEKLLDEMEGVFITPIALGELYKGAYLHNKSEEKVQEVGDFISNFNMLDFNEAVCNKFGEEYFRLSRIGKMTSEFDLMIACIDKKHFENIDVKI